tara:strand:+ start:672 stop:860 length:189 start_codon:yes stop_codon:yes gene_type:complete
MQRRLESTTQDLIKNKLLEAKELIDSMQRSIETNDQDAFVQAHSIASKKLFDVAILHHDSRL